MMIYKLKQIVCPSRITSDEYVMWLNKKGIKCGKHTVFFDTSHISLDISRPWMLELGDYCKITSGVTILTHDYSRSVLRRVYGEVIGATQKTVIGDNVFIGMNAIILMGTQIGDNVIIGAGSVVRGTIPSNCVVAGNPAKVICTLEEHYQNRKKKYVNEAMDSAILYKEKYGDYPTIEKMQHFFPLYLERSRDALKENNIFTKMSGDDEEEIISYWLKSEPLFVNYEAFLHACESRREA